MERIISGTDIKKVDEYTINEVGIPSLVLMERAAKSVADLIEETTDKNSEVIAIAGTGNNGADGVAVCRMLYIDGYNTCIYIMGNIDKATQEFKTQIEIAQKVGIEIKDASRLTRDEMDKKHVIVDSIFGVGLSRNVEGDYKKLIEAINQSKAKVYAVDIPSGLNADTGKVMGVAVKADYTVCFGGLKLGTVLYPGADYCGKLSFDNIGFPDISYKKCETVYKYHTSDDLKLIPKRPNYSNKGTYGKLLVIAGNKDITGAAFLCAKAAFRTGAGLVRIFTAKENREVIQKLLPEAMVNVYDTDDFDKKALDACIEWANVIAIGPGIGTGGIQKNMVEAVLESRKNTVIDADGINVISQNVKLKKMLHKNVILTPHLGEMARFENKTIDEIKDNLVKSAFNINYMYNANGILKDARSVAVTQDDIYINMTGNSGMATAGSGDVLTGIVAGLLAIGCNVENATTLAPYIHGIAGDLVATKMPKASLMATDIIEEIKNIMPQ